MNRQDERVHTLLVRILIWWAHQGQIPGRRKLLVKALGLVVVLMIVIPFLPAGFQTGAVLTVSAWLIWEGYLAVRKLRGISGPIGRGPKLLLVPVVGFIAIVTIAGSSATPSGQTDDLGSQLLTIVIQLFLIGGVFIGVTVVGIIALVQHVRKGRARPMAHAVMGAGEWAGAEPETHRVLGILNNPGQLNRFLFDAGLRIKVQTYVASSRRRSGGGEIIAPIVDITRTIRGWNKGAVPGSLTDSRGDEYSVPRLVSVQASNQGPVALLTVLPGYTESAYDKGADALANSMRISKIRISQLPEDRAQGLIRMTFVLSNPLREIVPYDWNAPVSYTSIPFGNQESGELLCLGFLESNLLFGGTPGGGKSGGITTYLAGISRLSNVAIVGLDPKQVEQAAWAPRFSRIATKLDDALNVLNLLTAEMDDRYSWLAARGKGEKKFDESMLEEKPLIALVIDELAELVAMGNSKDEKNADAERVSEIQRLVQKGRAAGIMVVCATQKPAGDVIPTKLRDLIQQRAAYATTNQFMTDVILGQGMSSNGGVSHEIAGNEKGVCYVVNESSRTPIKARTFWIPDEDVAAIAQRTAHLRIELDWLNPAADPADLGAFTQEMFGD
jgi:hypothetical protein